MKYEDKYLNRITSQHKIQPKYMAWLSALLEKLDDLSDTAKGLEVAFNLDSAVGIQLDKIGEIVGVGRLLSFEPRYAASALLPDEDYRLVIRAKISLNQWDGTTQGIYDLWSEIFPDTKIEVVDNQDMTVTIRIIGFNNPFASEYISKGYAAPKSEGVGMNYEFIFTITLNGDIYEGSIISDALSRFKLPEKDMGDDFAINGQLFNGAYLSNFQSRFELGSMNSTDTFFLDGYPNISGMPSNMLTRFQL